MAKAMVDGEDGEKEQAELNGQHHYKLFIYTS
jgi:hypothetical protein